ncbi:MAG: ScyD/ScyE family protein [Ferruginibacter sp.]|nr:ScyD/ScyE family protein [Cytophagales bacterium]
MRTKSLSLLALLVLLLATSCRELEQLIDEAESRPLKLKADPFAAGLANPQGLQMDPKGQIWVTEAGTGKDDGKVSLVTPAGKVYPAIEGFRSFVDPQGDVVGLNHLLLKGNTLWILHVEGNLYRADISSFRPGDAPLQAADLETEDIGSFSREYAFEGVVEDPNPYNLTSGPGGDIYIVDASANAIIRRKASGELSVFARVPGIANPTPIGPPVIQAVPTGIVFDGHRFLVSTLLGFPFPAEKSRIYQFDQDGTASVYQEGLTSLVDIELGLDLRPVVLQYSAFTPQGFAPNAGRVVRSTGQKNTTLLEGLNFPIDIERTGLKTYYVASRSAGTIQKFVY